MFKPTQPLYRRLRRLALTTKMVNGGFYKGTGSGSTGRHTKHGGYIIEWHKVRNYVVPSGLKDFPVGAQSYLSTAEMYVHNDTVDALRYEEDEAHERPLRWRREGGPQCQPISEPVEDGKWRRLR